MTRYDMTRTVRRALAGDRAHVSPALVPVAVALAVAGTGLLLTGVLGQVPAPPQPPAPVSINQADATQPPTDGPKLSTTPSIPRQAPSLSLPDADPIRFSIPRLGVSTTLQRLHLARSGALAAPKDGTRAGWYADGTAPGSPGTAVIAGHVTYDGPAVFFRLGSARRGDRFEVERADGRRAVFTVTAIHSYPRTHVPDTVYEPTQSPTLQVITCGGSYDRETHRYSNNIIVTARLTAVVTRPRMPQQTPGRP